AGCPPSTSGCDTPLKTVKSSRCRFSSSRYGDSAYPRPFSCGKNCSGSRPRLLHTASIRRGFAAAFSGAPAARANAGNIESSHGSVSTRPAPRRNCRRESARRVAMKDPATLERAGLAFMGCCRGGLLLQEKFALHNPVNQRAHPILFGGRALQDSL